MSVVLKSVGATAPEGASKLYRDAVVNSGTLFAVDFSNKGTLKNYDVTSGAPVLDLAREAASDLGFINSASVIGDEDFSLTAGKGFNTGDATSGDNKGILVSGGLGDYLASNQPHSLLILWYRAQATPTGNFQFFRSIEGTSYSNTNIRANFNSSAFGLGLAVTFGGTATPVNPITRTEEGQLVQFAVEFQGVGQPLKIYKNGVLVTQSSGNATGFTSSDAFGIGRMEDVGVGNAGLYRMIVEDLDVSGRSVYEALQDDYHYCRGVGKYDAIAPRPFIDTI